MEGVSRLHAEATDPEERRFEEDRVRSPHHPPRCGWRRCRGPTGSSAAPTRAPLFLKLAWHCAARAGDLGTLLKKDVHISALSESSPTASVSITIRYGKGARFRGPYAIGTRLQREDAALLLKLVRSRGPTQRLFAGVTSLCDQTQRVVRYAGSAPERSRRRRPATHAGAGPAAERRILHRQALGAHRSTGGDAVPAVPDGARAGREKGPDHAHGGGHGPLCDCAGAAEAQRLRRHRQRVLPEPPVRVHDGPLLYRARAGGVLLHRRPGEPRG
ncbi:hypothetical protein LSCM1_05301 [Leishmania martiniquensis]|uniref:Uncharacterized protein n=1 Tax=Leishmania martiniquensis TaxID=1580590 RepID=A0A836G7Y7_9TRYP|nr:hypothetical protein LSCM1_05301 [Leishmania martiniquensis]